MRPPQAFQDEDFFGVPGKGSIRDAIRAYKDSKGA